MFGRKPLNLEKAKATAEADVPVSRYIPFAVHMSPGVIKLRENGDLVSTWRLHGINFETAAMQEIANAKNQLVNFLHSIRGTELAEPTAIWVHRVRRLHSDRLEGKYSNEFAAKLADKYWNKLEGTEFLQNEIYFSLVLRPSEGLGRVEKRARTASAQALTTFDTSALKRFEVLCDQVTGSLAKYGGERLTAFTRQAKSGAELYVSPNLSLFRFLLTGVYEEVTIEQGSINEYLCPIRIFAGDGNGIVLAEHPRKRTFIGYLDLLDYPAFTEPGMNDVLFYGEYEFVETQSFSFLGKQKSLAALKLQQKRLISSGEGSPEQIADMNGAIEDVRNGRVMMGEFHYTLGVYGDSVADAQRNMSFARTALQEQAGYKVATIDLIPEAAHFAQLPGNWMWRPRQASITSRNFASLSPFHNFDEGKREGNPWGEALAIFNTPSRQAYYLNLHQMIFGKNRVGERDPGNTFICGMTGTGKSVLLGFLLAMVTKVPKLRILFFDKDRGAEILIRALGGRYRQLKRGQPTGFNPFQWEPTASNIKFVEQLVLQCARRDTNESLEARLENELTTAVRRVFALPERTSRRISAVLQFVGENSEAGVRLSKWCRTRNKEGANAWVLDNAVDTTDFSGYAIFGYDYTEFLGDTETGPIILSYILAAAEALINGDPFVYVMEEFAKAVSSQAQALVEFARDKQTTIRKLNGLGIFVTQSPSQVIQYPIGSTLREQCATQIFLPNPGADRADYVAGFQLSEPEFEVIKGFDPDSRKFLVKQGERSTVCVLNLYGFDDELAVLSGDPTSVAILDAIRAELRTDDPKVWMNPFLEKLRQTKAANRAALTAPSKE